MSFWARIKEAFNKGEDAVSSRVKAYWKSEGKAQAQKLLQSLVGYLQAKFWRPIMQLSLEVATGVQQPGAGQSKQDYVVQKIRELVIGELDKSGDKHVNKSDFKDWMAQYLQMWIYGLFQASGNTDQERIDSFKMMLAEGQ